MLNRNSAKQKVEDFLKTPMMNSGSGEFVVLDESTIEKPWGWIFFFQSKRYLETGNVSDKLAGNAPIFVNRNSGEPWPSGTAKKLEQYISEYEKRITKT